MSVLSDGVMFPQSVEAASEISRGVGTAQPMRRRWARLRGNAEGWNPVLTGVPLRTLAAKPLPDSQPL